MLKKKKIFIYRPCPLQIQTIINIQIKIFTPVMGPIIADIYFLTGDIMAAGDLVILAGECGDDSCEPLPI